ncbi:hypothetical protein HRG_014474 [Hirsutella rhossiliensis]
MVVVKLAEDQPSSPSRLTGEANRWPLGAWGQKRVELVGLAHMILADRGGDSWGFNAFMRGDFTPKNAGHLPYKSLSYVDMPRTSRINALSPRPDFSSHISLLPFVKNEQKRLIDPTRVRQWPMPLMRKHMQPHRPQSKLSHGGNMLFRHDEQPLRAPSLLHFETCLGQGAAEWPVHRQTYMCKCLPSFSADSHWSSSLRFATANAPAGRSDTVRTLSTAATSTPSSAEDTAKVFLAKMLTMIHILSIEAAQAMHTEQPLFPFRRRLYPQAVTSAAVTASLLNCGYSSHIEPMLHVTALRDLYYQLTGEYVMLRHQVDVTGPALVGGQRITPQITADYPLALDITSAGLMSSSERHKARKPGPTTTKPVRLDSLRLCDQNAPCLRSYILSVARLR